MDEFLAKNIIASTEEIRQIYPLSLCETDKKVIFKDTNQSAYAMCAVDALGFYPTFGRAIEIHSACKQSAEPIVLSIDEEGLSILEGGDSICVLHKDLREVEHWASSCCCIMHFFKDRSALELWCAENLCCHQGLYALSLSEAYQMAKNLFGEASLSGTL